MGQDEIPKDGASAPDFTLPSTEGRRVSLRELQGSPVVLYFYPRDDTPGCTKEACGFRDHLPRFTGLNATVLGVSTDDLASHARFRSKYNLPFHLLSDTDAAVAKAYGVYGKKNLYGREVWGVRRTTFIIDRQGRIVRVFQGVKVEGHPQEVLEAVKGL